MITLKLEGLRCLLQNGETLCAEMAFAFDGEQVTLSSPELYCEIPGLDSTDALRRAILSAALERGISTAIDTDGSELDLPHFFEAKQCGR